MTRLTPEVKRAIHKKRVTFTIMKNDMTEPNKRMYRTSRDDVKKKVRAAKRSKELDLAKNCKADSKKFFSFYKLSSGSKTIGPLKSNDMLISKDDEMLQLFSDQFKSVFTIEEQNGIELLHHQPVTEATMEELGNINRDSVRVHLKQLKPNKAEGPDEVYARILKECENELSIPLAIIFSRSLFETKIPLDWKRANVVPRGVSS